MEDMAFFIVPIIGTMPHVPKFGTSAQASFMPPIIHMSIRTGIHLIALLRCFKAHEQALHLSQILVRSYGASEAETRRSISALIRAGCIDVRRTSTSLLLPGCMKQSRLILIRSGKTCDEAESLIKNITNNLKNELMTNPSSRELLKELMLDLLITDCIRYVQLHAEKVKLSIVGIEFRHSKLLFLLHEFSLKQIFMLLWRAVQSCAGPIINREMRVVTFDQIIENAYRYFLGYQRTGTTVESYIRPQQMTRSSISNIIYQDLLGIEGDCDELPGIEVQLYTIDRHCISV